MRLAQFDVSIDKRLWIIFQYFFVDFFHKWPSLAFTDSAYAFSVHVDAFHCFELYI